MTRNVLAIVHEVSPAHCRTMLGSLLPAMKRRGFDVNARDVREIDSLDLANVDLLCVMGSPESVYDTKVDWIAPEEELLREADATGVPILGICFGGQLLAQALGGSVGPSPEPEYGFVTVRTTRPEFVAPGPWMQFHVDAITPPDSATILATTEHSIQAFAIGRHLGLQFHPEVTSECFGIWNTRTDARADMSSNSGLDIESISTEIEQRSRSAAGACDELFGRFLLHAGGPDRQ